jgi:hypothetical protein
VPEHWDIDSLSSIEESYEPPVLDADPDLIADLRAAIASADDVQEAWLVAKRVAQGGREKVRVGVVAHVGGRWRVRRQLTSLREALRPFYPPPLESRLHWGAYGNSPVPDEVRVVGIRLM